MSQFVGSTRTTVQDGWLALPGQPLTGPPSARLRTHAVTLRQGCPREGVQAAAGLASLQVLHQPGIWPNTGKPPGKPQSHDTLPMHTATVVSRGRFMSKEKQGKGAATLGAVRGKPFHLALQACPDYCTCWACSLTNSSHSSRSRAGLFARGHFVNSPYSLRCAVEPQY